MKNFKIFSGRPYLLTETVLLVVAVFTLIVLPADFFDEGSSICFSVLFFDKECYGCGMTRALMHFLHLDLTKAYTFNKLSFLVAPVLAALFARRIHSNWRKAMSGMDSLRKSHGIWGNGQN